MRKTRLKLLITLVVVILFYYKDVKNDDNIMLNNISLVFNPLTQEPFGNSSKYINIVHFETENASMKFDNSESRKIRIDHQTSTEDWLKKMEDKYRKINNRIHTVCKRYGATNESNLENHHQPDYHQILYTSSKTGYLNMMVDTQHRLAYCRHGKTGTSTWLSYFVKLLPKRIRRGIMKDKNWMELTHSTVPRHFKVPVDLVLTEKNKKKVSFLNAFNSFLQTYKILSFSFVRHPFERLVSAYREKVLMLPYMKTKFKQWYDRDHTFPGFVNLVIHQYMNDVCYNSYFLPCYNIDVHWKPFNARCMYCDIPYNVIGRKETFEEDVKYIFLKQRLDKVIPVGSFQTHARRSDKFTQNNNKENETLHYLNQLSQEQIHQLQKMYSLDFEMFDYYSIYELKISGN